MKMNLDDRPLALLQFVQAANDTDQWISIKVRPDPKWLNAVFTQAEINEGPVYGFSIPLCGEEALLLPDLYFWKVCPDAFEHLALVVRPAAELDNYSCGQTYQLKGERAREVVK